MLAKTSDRSYCKHMDYTEVIRLVDIWVKKIGKREAIVRLVNRKVPVHTAEKVCAGRYSSNPRDLLANVLIEEMGRDGVSLTDEIAS